MGRFRTPPEWWITLANLFDWFDWDAIGAVGSVGALFFAITLASRDTRARRQQSGTLLMAVMQPLSSATNVLDTQWSAGRKINADPATLLRVILATGVFEQMKLMLDEVAVKELPTPAAMDAFIAGRSALQNVIDEGNKLADENPDHLLVWVPDRISDLIAYHEAIANEALRFVSARHLVNEMTRGNATQAHTRSRHNRGLVSGLRKWTSERVRSKRG